MTRSVPRRAAGTAAAVLALGAAGWAGVTIGGGPPPAPALTPTTSELTTTTRPATTATRPPATTTVVLPEVEDIPPVVVYESPPVTPWDSGYESCDAACTEDIMDGYGSGTTAYEPPPCRPSTFGSCDPEEPMELPVFGCDYLERDFFGDVRCVD